jgi:hypothetical protein
VFIDRLAELLNFLSSFEPLFELFLIDRLIDGFAYPSLE